MIISIFKKLFHYTILPVESYKQLQIYETGHFQLENGSTSYIFKFGENALIPVCNL